MLMMRRKGDGGKREVVGLADTIDGNGRGTCSAVHSHDPYNCVRAEHSFQQSIYPF